ncbi:hypothetical protein QQS21_000164 [Conoideocrella luteorostrata]|uniref:Subtilisin-like serine protease n=1 Tax=Conoideocrella luteorostrata TaxID=1105319 RepID=A0AAJ0CZ96_9HYPO|nr:hypothetical protein QQS21_000164 [Conoideocrella luteorostrata]
MPMSKQSQYGADLARQQKPILPFCINLLEREGHHGIHEPVQDIKQPLLALLPATYRTESGDLIAAGRYATSGIEKELSLERLTTIHSWLWFAGLPTPPRPLHHQLLIGRQIIVTEQMDMHLIWETGRIFLKPIPRYLLAPDFWAAYLCCTHGCDCARDTTVTQATADLCQRRQLGRRALGFLFSYAALISSESDFRIAQEKYLIPSEVHWPGWKVFVDQLDLGHIQSHIEQRFHHGELRLSRLNILYALFQTPFRGYVARWNQYSTFIRDYFTWLAGMTIYIAIVLPAMQVGLATEILAHNNSFQAASYGFTVFAIFGPLVVAVVIVLVFCSVFLLNLVRTLNFRDKRLAQLVRQE